MYTFWFYIGKGNNASSVTIDTTNANLQLVFEKVVKHALGLFQ